MNSYQQIPIEECGELLVPIPLDKFAVELPHPYEQLGASYGDRSPYCLRSGVITALEKAQFLLDKSYPGWKLKIFDAYRPVGVQQFMVDYTYNMLLRQQGLLENKLSPQQRQNTWDRVYQFWAAPSLDPTTPPPHSTGAAIDLTLSDHRGITLDLGGAIDEISPRSYPEHYVNSQDIKEQQYHRRRQLLERVMSKAGFSRHPKEWWHFSLGDQMWAWLHNQNNPDRPVVARYGRV